MSSLNRMTIVLLITQDMDQNLNKYELARLEEYLSANHLKAGISNFFQYLEDTARFYRQAVDSVRIANRLNVPDALCYYSDYYVYRMLETFEKEDSEIRFLIHPGLMKLYLYDQKRENRIDHDTKRIFDPPRAVFPRCGKSARP